MNFDEKFEEIEKYYSIESPDEVKNFLRDNSGICMLLDEVKPYLKQSFAEDKYCLEMIYDPECSSCNHLVLKIYVSLDRFQNGVIDDIEFVREKLRPLRRQYKVLSEFAINPGVENV